MDDFHVQEIMDDVQDACDSWSLKLNIEFVYMFGKQYVPRLRGSFLKLKGINAQTSNDEDKELVVG